MKKAIVSTLFTAAAVTASAQSAVDAYQLSQGDLRGTARFMSMGGAFTALGGDLSTLNQNPAGIGIYRKSDVGVTVDFNMANSKVNTPAGSFTQDKTHVYCNNFGYIGTVNLDSDVMYTFNWGASYSRVASFDRTYRAGSGNNPIQIGTSLSNYIAYVSDGIPTDQLAGAGNVNPYDTGAPWLSVLGYNSALISPGSGVNTYDGMWKNGTSGDMLMSVRERGYVDEYAIDFGGNIMDMVYWGVGFGITDLKFTQETLYDEQVYDANIPDATGTTTVNGDGGYALSNYRHITGTGFNFKVGVIVKPINELRFGFAVHTPTYYSLDQDHYGSVDFEYSSGYGTLAGQYPYADTDADLGYFQWKLKSPWRMMFGIAGVIGGRGVLSLDYERASFGDMKISDRGYAFNYDLENGDIKNYFQAQNTIRVGGELRVTPQFSIRAGYAYSTTNVKSEAEDNRIEIYTSGTNPAYTFNKSTQYVTLGLGYRYQAFYVDAAYVYKNRKSTYHAFTDYANVRAPQFDFSDTNNNIVVSLGFKF